MRPTEKVEESIFSLMRKMDDKTKLIVPIEHWVLVRTYAQTLKRDFGAAFSVRRMMTPYTKLNLILIERKE